LKNISLIVGLGNPGNAYASSWHNAGFSLLDIVALGFRQASWKNFKNSALYMKVRFCGETVFLLKPQKYMNNSGRVLNQFASFYKITPKEMLVCYDDVDLDLATIRIRKKGSSGGHRGIEDVITHLGTKEFARIKIGIGPVSRDIPCENFVLSKIPKDKKKIFDEVLRKSADAVYIILDKGVDAAMNEFN
jgi:PTH1 family peptidyl-tRNA hydrolase